MTTSGFIFLEKIIIEQKNVFYDSFHDDSFAKMRKEVRTMDRKEYSFHTQAAICLCIDRVHMRNFEGELWHQYAEPSVCFKDIVDLLKKMENLYDSWNFPQETTKKRLFRNKEGIAKKNGAGKAQEREMSRLEGKKGNEGTFMVHVMYRQNSTWQGEIVWVEQKKKQKFRSALELIRLIDSAVEEDENSSEGTEDWNEALPL